MAHAPGMIDLKGSKDPGNRLTLMTALLSSVDAKVNHFDGLRQRNLVLAMVIFAGLSGFSLRADHGLEAALTALALGILMALFWALDHKLDRYNCGWQHTRSKTIRALQAVVNQPEEDVSFPRYDASAERHASIRGLKSMLHGLLLAGAVCLMIYTLVRTLLARVQP